MFQNTSQPNQKTPHVERELKRWIQEAGVGAKLPTVKAMCGRLNVAIGTLNSALNSLESQGLIDRQRGRGIFVAPGVAQKRVALVFGTKNPLLPGASPFYGALIQGCEKRAATHNERFSFFIGSPKMGQASADEESTVVHHDLARALRERQIDGIILVSRESERQEEWLRSQGVPVVVYGGWPGASTSPGHVSMDLGAMVNEATETLLARGCRSLGVLAAHPRHCDLFRAAQRRIGFAIREDWVAGSSGQDKHMAARLVPLGREVAMEVMLRSGWSRTQRNLDALPDGLLITNDTLASGALPCLARMGIHAGREIQIATHANKDSPALVEWESGLILAEYDTNEIVEAVFDGLETLMAGKSLRHPFVAIQPQLRTCPLEDLPLP